MIFFPRSQSAADSQTPGQLGWRKSSLLVYPSAILLTTFLSFLGFHNYPLLSLESLIILGGALGLGLTFSTLIALGGHWLEVPIAATLLAFFADVQFDWRLRYVLVFGLAMLAAGWLVRRNLSQIMGAVFATVLVTTVVLPTEKTLVDTPDAVSRPAKDPDLAPLVHIVLDEHVGIEGIPGPFNKPAGSKDQIKAFYQTLGFRLYGNAYTRYANTEDSLPNILNFTRKARNRKSVLRSRDFIYLDENEYFRQLSRKGYVMRIYQSQFMDFCRSRDISVESCESYNYTGLDQLDKLANNPATKSLIILSRHLNRSRIYGILRSRYQNLARQEIIPIPILENNNFAPLAALPFFDRLGRDLKNARRGVAYFAHLLIPHRPFMFDEACNVVLDQKYDRLVRGNDTWLAEYRSAYYRQVGCTYVKLGQLIEGFKKHELFGEATIVIHGDHGSRIGTLKPALENAGRLTEAMIKEYYSTLFAVKKPSLEPGYSLELAPVEDLLQSHILSQPPTGRQGAPGYHYVFLESTKNKTFAKKLLEPGP